MQWGASEKKRIEKDYRFKRGKKIYPTLDKDKMWQVNIEM